METKKIDEKDDITIIEQTSISTHDFHSKSPPPMSSIKNKNSLEFPDEDFDFDDCDIINKIKESQRFFIHFYAFSYYFQCTFIVSIYLFFIRHFSVNKVKIL